MNDVVHCSGNIEGVMDVRLIGKEEKSVINSEYTLHYHFMFNPVNI